jgi:acetate kinase
MSLASYPLHMTYSHRMTLLTVNSGSTSVKLAAFASGAAGAAGAAPELRQSEDLPATADQAREVIAGFIERHRLSGIDAVAHRVVHGGTRFTRAVRIDAEVLDALSQLSELAPLHNPVALRWIATARSLFGAEVAQIAVFDTAFFSSLPRLAAEYALPSELGAAFGVRRYGFHGLAHEAMWQRWRQLRPDLPEGGRLISLQLGGGCSMAAVDRGRPMDTTMGFSPLEGLVMATRSGDVDPAIVPFLARHRGVSADRIIEILNRESGLLGVSGRSSDMRVLLGDQSSQAQLAVELYCYRAGKYLGAFFAVLGGCDGIVFGGGVGEHAPHVRERILAPMRWAGVLLDDSANAAALGQQARISAAESRVAVHVIPVDEAQVIAAAALACLRA